MVPSNQAKRWTIIIEPGTYRERVWIKSQLGPLTLQGMGAPEETLLVFHCCPAGDGKKGCSNGTVDKSCRSQRAGAGISRGVETLLIEADDFVMMNMSVANNACNYDQKLAHQSEAAKLLADRMFFRHVRFLGAQDTIFSGRGGTRQYFMQSFINGSCDSIYGSSSMVLDRCEVAITDHVTAMRGAITKGAESTYLFLNSSLVKPRHGDASFPAKQGGTELGRPWGSLGLATVVYKNTFMDDHIAVYGWGDWSHHCSDTPDHGANCKKYSTCWCQNVTYAEYQSHGPGATMEKLKGRVKWSQQLTEHDAESFTAASVMRGWTPPIHTLLHPPLGDVLV
jgi:pectinesterase